MENASSSPSTLNAGKRTITLLHVTITLHNYEHFAVKTVAADLACINFSSSKSH